MPVPIHGKEYRTVAERIRLFYNTYKDKITAITTEIIKDEKNIIQVKATISAMDKIENPTFFVFGNGFAEEDRTNGRINSTSALENCETSAIGRALASIGLGGEEYTSADELLNAMKQQDESKNKTLEKDDGGSVTIKETKSNGVLGLAEEAKKKMTNGSSTAISDGVCNFTKHKGKLWSVVAKEDLDYITWILNNVKDLDSDTGKLLNQFV
jgi:hypothetical protein